MWKSILLGVGGVAGITFLAEQSVDLHPDKLVIGGMALIFIIDKVLGQLKNRGIDLSKLVKQMDELHKHYVIRHEDMVTKINDLYEWHEKRDEDGIFRWYLPSCSRKNIDRNYELLTECLRLTTAINRTCHECQMKHDKIYNVVDQIERHEEKKNQQKLE